MNRYERRAMARLAETIEGQRNGRPKPDAGLRLEMLEMMQAFEDAALKTLTRQGARVIVLETMLEQAGILTPEKWQAAVDRLLAEGVAGLDPTVVG